MPTVRIHDSPGALRSTAIAALATLIVLNLGMFASMLAGVEPHPPGARGPYIAATAALATATLLQVIAARGGAVPLLTLTALAFIPGVGPHKFFTESAAHDLAPVIIVGTGALLTLLVVALRLHRLQREAASDPPLRVTTDAAR
jgi:fatty acid desaturase